MTGDKDRLIPPRLGAELAAEIPGARLVMVAGAGHVLMLERPDVVNDAIAGVLARGAAGRSGRGSSGGPAAREASGELPEDPGVTVPTAAAMRALGRRLAGLLRAG